MHGGGLELTAAPSPEEVTLALVVSDFGRDAALRFCTVLAGAEREAIQRRLTPGVGFLDEHRRLTLTVVGDLPFAKRRTLAAYRGAGRALDEGVLVGFPGGPRLESLVGPIGTLVLEALSGPVRRGLTRAVVLLPCNTLAPLSWALAERLTSRVEIEALVEAAGVTPWPFLDELAARLTDGRLALELPTVPGAVLREAARRGASRIVPWGTEAIAEVYAEAARRERSPIEVTPLEATARETVRGAILASIDGGAARRRRARRELEALASTCGAGTLPIEACTDLDYGIGLDSVEAYARVTVADTMERLEHNRAARTSRGSHPPPVGRDVKDAKEGAG